MSNSLEIKIKLRTLLVLSNNIKDNLLIHDSKFSFQQSNIKYKWCYISEIKNFDIRNNCMTAESYDAEVNNTSPLFTILLNLIKIYFETRKKLYSIEFFSKFKIDFY